MAAPGTPGKPTATSLNEFWDCSWRYEPKCRQKLFVTWRHSMDPSEPACAWVGPCVLVREVSCDLPSNINSTKMDIMATTFKKMSPRCVRRTEAQEQQQQRTTRRNDILQHHLSYTHVHRNPISQPLRTNPPSSPERISGSTQNMTRELQEGPQGRQGALESSRKPGRRRKYR